MRRLRDFAQTPVVLQREVQKFLGNPVFVSELSQHFVPNAIPVRDKIVNVRIVVFFFDASLTVRRYNLGRQIADEFLAKQSGVL